LATVAGAGAGGEDVLEAVDEPDDDALDRARDRLHRMGVPVARRPPLHAVLARSGAGDVLMLSVNHAAGDAFAAVEVLVAVARAYAPDDAGAGGAPLDFLATHALPFGPAPGPRSRLMRVHKRGVERLRDLLAPPALLTADEPDEQSGYGFHLVTVPAEETSRLLAPGATEPGRTAVMTALHLAIGDWHRRHGGPGRRVGVLGTVDLRPHPWRPATIGNFSMTARVSTTPYQRARADRALRAVNAQTTRNKRTRTGIALIAALDRAGLLPLWVSQSVVVLRPVTHNRFVDTAVLCNLGSVEAPAFGPEAGETLGLWCSAPARSPHALSVGVTTAGGRLHLTFRYPHRLFGAAAARRFAACYLAQLRAVVEAQGRAEGR
ncbi:MAG TPA: hypothetical protein VFO65_09125, partial [Acidimicrobiales bacterium]|nr:hypothetical protein [Acidimicrobiales bacterium]